MTLATDGGECLCPMLLIVCIQMPNENGAGGGSFIRRTGGKIKLLERKVDTILMNH
jgi:hypothetical protein